MPLKTKRWNDPAEPDDGFRLLITRYRPRGVSKADETWDQWRPHLGPSKDLHAAVYTDTSSKIPWPRYRRQYLEEQRKNKGEIEELAKRIAAGETITLLCSSACTRESRCHRSILRELIEVALAISSNDVNGPET
ncbi:MAG: hypothetical protein JWP03_1407 [Phycisphaerales bacterium]|jgi:uncharacterized protein YeaO (DUF488 family)|nr:hypothetical protein [Phycisphaerales bacterium]